MTTHTSILQIFFFTIITISIALISFAILFLNAVMLLRLPKSSMTQTGYKLLSVGKARDLGLKRPKFTIITLINFFKM